MSKKNNNSLEFELDDLAVDQIEIDVIDALWKTAEYLATDVKQSQTMPFDTGTMQNESTYVTPKGRRKNYKLVTNTPYAKKLYYHPEYNFKDTTNPDAGAYWFRPYISGDKKYMALDVFKKFCKKG